MKIKEVEKILKVSRANIRFYEKEGLLTPTRGDSEYRNYSDKDIVKLKKIIMLRKCNMSIDDIKCLFNKTKSLEEISLKQIQNYSFQSISKFIILKNQRNLSAFHNKPLLC